MVCICNELRKTARIVTEHYEKELAPVGLKLNQYSLLTNLSRLESAAVTELAEKLELDQTSTSRSVALLERMGLIERVKHEDPRVKLLKLTTEGKKKLKAATPLWEKAQSKMQEKVSKKAIRSMVEWLQELREQ